MTFQIAATYERIAYRKTPDPAAVTYHDQSLRVDGTGDIPQDSSKILLQIQSEGDVPYRFRVPLEFSQHRSFIVMATELLPFQIEYGKSVMVSIIEADGDAILARALLKYRTA